MKAKATKVALYSPTLQTEREFEISHAERILRMSNSGWELSNNSKFEFVGNGIRRKADKESNKRGKEKDND